MTFIEYLVADGEALLVREILTEKKLVLIVQLNVFRSLLDLSLGTVNTYPLKPCDEKVYKQNACKKIDRHLESHLQICSTYLPT